MLIIIAYSIPSVFAGDALRFERQQREWVEIETSESLDLDGEAITMEAWINMPSPAQDLEYTIMNKENSYELHVRRGLFQVAIWTTNQNWAWLGGNNVIQANRWYHVAATYDGENARVYVDGDLRSTHALRGRMVPRDTSLFIGTRPLSNFIHCFEGVIDEVRLWNITRTEQELSDNMNVMLAGNEEGLIGYWRFDEGEGQVAGDRTEFENHGIIGTDEDEDDRDPEWIESDAPIRGGVLEVSLDQIAFTPLPGGEAESLELLLSNVSEQEDEVYQVEYSFEDDGRRPDWLTFEPEEGTIDPMNEVNVEFIVNAENLDLGEYEHSVTLFANASNLRELELPITVTVVAGAGRLHGRVVSAANDQPVAGSLVRVVADFDLSTETDDEGNYDFEIMPAYNYHLLVTAEDFLPLEAEEVQIQNEGDVELNFELLHAEGVFDPELIQIEMEADDSLTTQLSLRNAGNGPLTWHAERVFPELVDAEPWEMRWSIQIAEVLENNRIGAVAFVDELLYVAGSIRGAENQIYVLNREGELLSQFNQFTDSNYGFRGLTWDGELLWGYDDGSIYGFTTDGEVVSQIESPLDPVRSITWDPVRQLLWVAYLTSDIFGITREGEVEVVIDRPPANLRPYGMAYYPEDPDGHPIYLFCGGDPERQIHKLNPETGRTMFVVEPEFQGSAGAAMITGLWDPYSWVFIGLTLSNADAIAIWQMSSRTEWVNIEPMDGIIEPDDTIEMDVNFNSYGMPGDVEFVAEFQFYHDGIGAQSVIPVNFTVSGEGGGGQEAQRTLNLRMGWNLVSLNIEADLIDFIDIVDPLIQEDLLIMAKNGAGRFYNHDFGFNQLEEWEVFESYWMKMERDAELIVVGDDFPWDTEIPLTHGWNFISYLPRFNVEAPVAFSNIVDALSIAKDGNGNFYSPQFGFSSMGELSEGNGYMIKVQGDNVLVYAEGEELASTPEHRHSTADENWINEVSRTDLSHSLLVIADENVPIGTRIEALTATGLVAGRGVIGSDGIAGLALWGDDKATEEVNGFVTGESFTIHFADTDESALIEAIQGDSDKWTTDGWGVITLKNSNLPNEFYLGQNYPNPFNAITTLAYGLPENAVVSFQIYDTVGRLTTTLLESDQQAGHHKVVWDARDISSGVYLVQMKSGDFTANTKVVLVK
ncbi:MAG: T9SS type A sorting domain-containing protein [Calditrichaeota bacterium]|nr:T9SS type A sorting domain-containing protein [Calditrichota bacterium]